MEEWPLVPGPALIGNKARRTGRRLGSGDPPASKLALSFDPKSGPFKPFHIRPNRPFQLLSLSLFLHKDTDLKGAAGTGRLSGNHAAAFPIIESEID